ncbi:hypothetical protein FLAVO9R_30211 [Flavobacterium sp. 9R]|nr:hypothetical protein FLAVO9R_30211 [Flavobacterium sp. 9R]
MGFILIFFKIIIILTLKTGITIKKIAHFQYDVNFIRISKFICYKKYF